MIECKQMGTCYDAILKVTYFCKIYAICVLFIIWRELNMANRLEPAFFIPKLQKP